LHRSKALEVLEVLGDREDLGEMAYGSLSVIVRTDRLLKKKNGGMLQKMRVV
jgi:hypothetical protein